MTALYAVSRNDMEGFKEAITDVYSFYRSQSKVSAKKYLMIGLHLMYLLVSDQLSEFHMVNCFIHTKVGKVYRKNCDFCYPFKKFSINTGLFKSSARFVGKIICLRITFSIHFIFTHFCCYTIRVYNLCRNFE